MGEPLLAVAVLVGVNPPWITTPTGSAVLSSLLSESALRL